MVVVVIVGSAGRGVEGGDAVKVQHKIFPVADRGMALIARNPHCGQAERKGFEIKEHISDHCQEINGGIKIF